MTKQAFVKFTRARVGSAAQSGATLIIGLVMLVLITLMVLSAFNMSSSNLKSVGNMQVHNEAIAAANAAIESVLSTSVVSTTTSVSIGGADGREYDVVIAVSPCLSVSPAGTGALSSLSLPVAMTSSSSWNVAQDMRATVTDSITGAVVSVHQGVLVLLSTIEKDAQCP